MIMGQRVDWRILIVASGRRGLYLAACSYFGDGAIKVGTQCALLVVAGWQCDGTAFGASLFY